MIQNHLIQGVRFQQTPNISPGEITPKYLIIHYSASPSLDGTVDWLCNPASRVSAHIVIGRDGEVVQIAKFNQKAWHCGLSEWNGEEGMNDRSIGIELIGLGYVRKDKDGKFWKNGREVPAEEVELATHKNEEDPRYWHKYTYEQIEVCKNVAREIFHAYNLKDIMGHDDIAPTRKTDPGPLFPMDELRGHIGQEKTSETVKDFALDDVLFECINGKIYGTFNDSEGGITHLFTTAEARALRDWLNENLK